MREIEEESEIVISHGQELEEETKPMYFARYPGIYYNIASYYTTSE